MPLVFIGRFFVALSNGLSCLATDPVAFPEAVFGEGIVPILVDDIECTGSEDSLLNCTYDSSTFDCTHSDDAGVACLAARELCFWNSNCLCSMHA